VLALQRIRHQIRLDVVENRIFFQVVANDGRNVRIDGLIV
jgi:hypothetical protein